MNFNTFTTYSATQLVNGGASAFGNSWLLKPSSIPLAPSEASFDRSFGSGSHSHFERQLELGLEGSSNAHLNAQVNAKSALEVDFCESALTELEPDTLGLGNETTWAETALQGMALPADANPRDYVCELLTPEFFDGLFDAPNEGLEAAATKTASISASGHALVLQTQPKPFVSGLRHFNVDKFDITQIFADIAARQIRVVKADPLLAAFDPITRFGNSLRNAEGFYGQRALAQCLKTIPGFRVFEELTIPVSAEAQEKVLATESETDQFLEKIDGRNNQRLTYKADMVVFDEVTERIHIIDCKRSVGGLGRGTEKSKFIHRFLASSMCIMAQLERDYGLKAVEVCATVVDLKGSGGRLDFVCNIGQLDKLLSVTGVSRALKQAVQDIEDALQARYLHVATEYLLANAGSFGLAIKRLQTEPELLAVVDVDEKPAIENTKAFAVQPSTDFLTGHSAASKVVSTRDARIYGHELAANSDRGTAITASQKFEQTSKAATQATAQFGMPNVRQSIGVNLRGWGGRS